jgi:RNA polymerase sigma-70 factor, ECF subfamily
VLPGKEDLRSIDRVARQHLIGRRETHHGSKGELVFEQSSPRNFEDDILPHLDAAYNLARWLTRNDQDAEDLVQEASLRALRFFGGFRGDNARAWFLKIVRNSYHARLGQKLGVPPTTPFNEPVHSPEQSFNPETLLLQKADRQSLSQALEKLPANFREVLVLREIEGLSYKEIAYAIGIPIGTVMSGLARARDRLRQSLSHVSYSDGLSKSASHSEACRQ